MVDVVSFPVRHNLVSWVRVSLRSASEPQHRHRVHGRPQILRGAAGQRHRHGQPRHQLLRGLQQPDVISQCDVIGRGHVPSGTRRENGNTANFACSLKYRFI